MKVLLSDVVPGDLVTPPYLGSTTYMLFVVSIEKAHDSKLNMFTFLTNEGIWFCRLGEDSSE